VTLDLTRLSGACPDALAVLDPTGGAGGYGAGGYGAGGYGALTYGELRRLADRCRRRLEWPAKALVAVDAPRSRAGLIAYLAALAAGHAVVLIEDGGEQLWTQLLETYRPELIVAQPGGAAAGHAGRRGYRPHGGDDGDGGGGDGDDGGGGDGDDGGGGGDDGDVGDVVGGDGGGGGGVAVWSRQPGRADDGPIHPDLAMLIRTSGSLGPPKTVRLSYVNLRANATAIADALRIRDRDRAMTSLPLDFSFGLSIANSHLAAGASIALTTATPSSAEFWWLLDQVRGTCAGAVPTTYRFLRSSHWEPREHPSLRRLLHAGGPLDDATLLHFAERMARAGGELITMYGLTEATARVAYLPPQRLNERLGSVGVPIPGGRIRIVRPDGKPAADGQTGEVVYEGPNVMMGYAACRADLAAGDVQHGRLRTGDRGRLQDGFLYLAGRADREVKIFGRRIAPEHIELSLAAHGVTAAVTPDGPDHLIVAIEGNRHDLPTCRQSIADQLGLPPAALTVIELDTLPRTRNGKINHAEMRRRPQRPIASSPSRRETWTRT
jgi:long-chain acyl-CoA synthetase